MAKEQILFIEDDDDIQELVRYNLAKEGYVVTRASTGEEGIKAALAAPFALVILDLMLPGMDGLAVCKYLKSDTRTKDLPIVMLTAKSEEADLVTGLELGADDYITKPFSPRVLVARVRAVLRRHTEPPPAEPDAIRIGALVVQPGRRQVLANGQPIDLTFTEFSVLHFLVRQPGWVFTRYQIVDAVRGEEYPVTERSVDVQIYGLRKKLGQWGDCIETVRGVGYRFKEPS